MNVNDTKQFLASSKFDWFALGEWVTLTADNGEQTRYRRDVYRRRYPVLANSDKVISVYVGIYYQRYDDEPLISISVIESNKESGRPYWEENPGLRTVDSLLSVAISKVREILDFHHDSIINRLRYYLLTHSNPPAMIRQAVQNIKYFTSIGWLPASEFLKKNKSRILNHVAHKFVIFDDAETDLQKLKDLMHEAGHDWPELNIQYITGFLNEPDTKRDIISQLLMGVRDNHHRVVIERLKRLKNLGIDWPELNVILDAVQRKKITESRDPNQMTERDQIEYVSRYFLNIKNIKNPSLEVQLAAVKQTGFAIRYIKNPSLAVQLAAVNHHGFAIRYIKNPSPEFFANPEIKAAVLKSILIDLKRGESIDYMLDYLTNHQVDWPELGIIEKSTYRKKITESRDPNQMTERDQIEYLIANPRRISEIQNPTERVQLTAIHANEWAIRYIKNPSEQAQLAAVTKSPFALEYIKNPSEQAQLAAVSLNPWVIEYIQNPSEEVQLAAVQQNGRVISFIENPTESTQLASVRREPLVIGDIDNPTERVKLAAVERNGYAVRYIKNPSERVQREVLINAPLAGITYITNIDPAVISTPEVKQSVMKHILTRIKYAKRRDDMDYDIKRFINRGFNYPELIYLLNAMTKKPIDTAEDK